jgi:hypothetical protein
MSMEHEPADPPADPGTPPLGIRLLTWLFWFWAGAVALVLLGFFVGEGPVMLGGHAVPRGEAVARVLPALLPMGLAVAGAALALGMGRPWGRFAALLPFIIAAFGPALSGLGSTAPGDLLTSVAIVVPMVAALVWYLYFSDAGRGYFGRRTGDPSVSGRR